MRDTSEKPREMESMSEILHVLEIQLASLDALGAMIPAAHVSAAVDYIRLDLANAELSRTTRH